MRAHRWITLLAVPGLLLTACSGDDDDALRDQITELEASRDRDRDRIAELEEADAARATRYERSLETQARVAEIIEDPTAYGTEDEVLDMLTELAADGASMDDTALGSVGIRSAWRNTLFGDFDATIVTWRTWMSEDGSSGGSLWTWEGTARNGEPFTLIGVDLTTFDEAGLLTRSVVDWPYPANEVARAIREGNG